MAQRIELYYKGRKVKGYRINVSSVFSTGIDKVWNKIQHVETLRYIARPWAQFNPIGFVPSQWKEGDCYTFHTWIHGMMPIGKHTINVMEMNRAKGKIYTNEYNRIIKIWNHHIIMEDKGNNTTGYTDIVDIYAGIFTRMVAWWSVRFYRYRQRKWKSIANNL